MNARGPQTFYKCRSHLKIVGAIGMNKGEQILKQI